MNKNCEHNIKKNNCIICRPSLLCIHNKRKNICRICNPQNFCEHNKRKTQCLICNPKIKCEHNKNKNNCAKCNKCEHDKIKKNCIICNPKIKCIHDKNKHDCSECNKKLICIHNIIKKGCLICNPNILCEHKKRKTKCITCSPNNFCIHDKRKDICTICNNKLLCIHNIHKAGCTLCNPDIICEHGKRKYKCIICNPEFFCIHNKRNDICMECNKNLKCIHNKDRKDYCNICSPNTFCKLCNYTVKNKKYDQYCSRCFYYLNPDIEQSRHYKTKENLVVSELKSDFNNIEYELDKYIKGACSKRRPDIRIELFTHSIIIEIDEKQHIQKDYTSCDTKRMMEIYQDLGYRNIIFLRFNPDGYLNDQNKRIRSCFDKNNNICNKKNWNERINTLKKSINYHINNIPEKSIIIEYLYYNYNKI